MSRTSAPFTVACLAMLASACGADRTTGPDFTSVFAAVAGSDPSPTTANTVSNVAIAIGWMDNSPNEGGFEIHRSSTGASGTFTRLAATTPNTTSYTDVALAPATQYCYKVRAFRAQGKQTSYSAFSNVACATTFSPPPAPTDVTASPRENGSVIVDWSGSSSASWYRVDRAAAATGPWEVAADGLNAIQYSDPDRVLEQQVCYRVAAINQWGEGVSTPRCTAPPAPPTDLVVHASAGGGLDVGWTDASAVEDGYEIQRAGSDYLFATIGTTAANATSYHDGTALSDTRYWYRVRATKDAGYSVFSGWADGINASAPPGAPTAVNAVPSSSSVVHVQWLSGPGAVSGFRVERSVSGGAWAALTTTAWAQEQLDDPAAAAEVEACYRVIAFNAAGDSPPSASDCARPLAAPANVVAVSAGSDAIDLTWDDVSAFENAYIVERIECSSDYYGYDYCYVVDSAALPPGSTSWRSTGLAA